MTLFSSDSLLMRLEPLRRHIAIWQAAWSLETLRPRLLLRTADELAFLPAAIEIIETPASPLGRGTLWLVMALFSAALAWACLGEVDIHATAPGRIIPGGKTKPVAPAEAATVAAIHVADGDRVRAGQILIELNPAATEADVARLRRERLEQVVTVARLKALVDGRDDIALPAEFVSPPLDGAGSGVGWDADLSQILAVHRLTLRQRLADHRATIEALEQERRQKQAERRATEADILRLERTVPLLSEQAKTKREMSDLGWQSRTDYLKVEQEHIDRTQELEGARHKLTEADSAINNVSERLRQAEAQFRGDALTQRADAEQKAASLSQDLAKAVDRDRLYKLTAPVDGVVQQLAVHAPGAVVSQAQPVLMIVPENEGIAVEAALPNKDAGFVRPGQAVEIKVESFPFTRYGTVPGTVQTVSGDAVQGPDSDPTQRRPGATNGSANSSTGQTAEGQGAVYSVRIRPSADTIRVDGLDVALTPGMVVTAEIKTGKRRVIEYVLDPVLRYRDESLRER